MLPMYHTRVFCQQIYKRRLCLRCGDPVEGFCDVVCIETPDGSSMCSCFNGPTLTLPCHVVTHQTRHTRMGTNENGEHT